MSFNRLAENKIREAIARGEFDNISRAGQRIDLEEYFRTPEDLRMAYSILRNANCVPREVDLLNEIAALERQLSAAATEDQRRAAQRAINDRRLQLAVILERRPKGLR